MFNSDVSEFVTSLSDFCTWHERRVVAIFTKQQNGYDDSKFVLVKTRDSVSQVVFGVKAIKMSYYNVTTSRRQPLREGSCSSPGRVEMRVSRPCASAKLKRLMREI